MRGPVLVLDFAALSVGSANSWEEIPGCIVIFLLNPNQT